jgi:hypothetical protein
VIMTLSHDTRNLPGGYYFLCQYHYIFILTKQIIIVADSSLLN